MKNIPRRKQEGNFSLSAKRDPVVKTTIDTNESTRNFCFVLQYFQLTKTITSTCDIFTLQKIMFELNASLQITDIKSGDFGWYHCKLPGAGDDGSDLYSKALLRQVSLFVHLSHCTSEYCTTSLHTRTHSFRSKSLGCTIYFNRGSSHECTLL